MKKTMKKIASIGVATAVAATSLTGALAANLGEYPAPFVVDGVADFQMVIGQNAATSDVIGAIDIAASLQADSVTTEQVDVEGSSEDRAISDGYRLSASGQEFVLPKVISEVDSKLDNSDLPDLLADGMIVDTDQEDEEYEYDQSLELSDIGLSFLRDSDFDDPEVFLDLDAQGFMFDLVVDFDENVFITHNSSSTDGEGLNDGETIQILGKDFTFDATTANDDDLYLYGADASEYFELNVPKTITTNGNTFEVEIVGANSEANSDSGYIILQVNGVRKTLEEGDSENVNGLQVFIQDLFVTDIPTLSASANIFIGSEEVKIPNSAQQTSCTNTSYKAVEVDGDNVDGLDVCVLVGTANEWQQVQEFRFRFDPDDMDVEYLRVGEEIEVPVFGTAKVVFEGPSVPFMDESRELIELSVSGDKYELTFTNEDGDEYTVEIAELEGEHVNIGEDIARVGTGYNASFTVPSGQPVNEDVIFFANEGTASGQVTKVYRVSDIDIDDSEVTFEDLSSGNDLVVQDGDELEDTDLYVDIDNVTSTFYFETSGGANTTTANTIYTQNDFSIVLSATNATNNYVSVGFSEDNFSDIEDDGAVGADFGVNITKSSSDTEIDNEIAGNISMQSDDDSDYAYALTQLGTYVARETDDESEFVRIYVADELVTYDLFFAPAEAEVVITGGSSVTTSRVNSIGVGIGVLDVDVNAANPSKNLIVVGGPAINSVADDLLSTRTADPLSVFEPGMAMVELFDLDNGKVAMLVAGYEALETQAAARQVASQDDDLFVNGATSATLTVSSLNNVQVSTN